MPKELLKDIIHNGIIVDIFNAEEAFGIEDIIGINATLINVATYGQLFGALQKFLVNSLILTVAKLYDKPKNKYVIRSIPHALDILENNAAKLDIMERPVLNRWFISRGYDKESIEKLNSKNITLKLVEYFRERMPSATEGAVGILDPAFYAVKTTRDKKISHNEKVPSEAVFDPTYQQILDLLTLAKEFVGAVGTPYLSTVYEDDSGKYIMSSDSGRSSRCLIRVLKRLKVIQD